MFKAFKDEPENLSKLATTIGYILPKTKNSPSDGCYFQCDDSDKARMKVSLNELLIWFRENKIKFESLYRSHRNEEYYTVKFPYTKNELIDILNVHFPEHEKQQTVMERTSPSMASNATVFFKHGKFLDYKEWLLSNYIDNPVYIERYLTDVDQIDCIAEAVYKISQTQTPFKLTLLSMNYAEIKNFKPLQSDDPDVQTVLRSLEKPSCGIEASHAFGQAMWCIYAKHRGVASMERAQADYERAMPNAGVHALN